MPKPEFTNSLARIEWIHRYVKAGQFETYEEVYEFVWDLMQMRDPFPDDLKLKIQRNQEIFINGEQYQFFGVYE